MEHKNLNKQETANSDLGAVSGCKNVVLSAERMPTKEGYYKTNIGIQYIENVPEGLGIKAGLSWQFGMTPEWWEE